MTRKIIIYQSDGNEPNIEVRLENDTLWLDQYQISDLFGTDRTSISKHIGNIYRSGELSKEGTCAKIAQVQTEGGRRVKRSVFTYNLDVIISVGYRVNSKRGTQFRMWASSVLRDHLVLGYSKNEARLKELQTTIELAKRTSSTTVGTEAQGLMEVLSDYAMALDILDDYDHQRLTKDGSNENIQFKINYSDAKLAIEQLREKFGGSSLFGNEKDQSFRSSISTIEQTFDGIDLYPSVEEKAANLLYFVVKNHSFTDGNKRIGAWLFLWYLDKNEFLYNPNGTKKIGDNALVALTLMIAESRSAEKEMMVNVIVNLINRKNESGK